MSKVDFFAYTFKNLNIRLSDEDTTDVLYEILKYLLPDPVWYMLIENRAEAIIADKSGMGYSYRLTYPALGVSIFCNGATDAHGTHVVLSGQSLAQSKMDREDFQDFNLEIDSRIVALKNLCYQFGVFDVYDPKSDLAPVRPLFSSLPDVSFYVSRIDIAYDFKVSFDDFFKRLEDGHFLYTAKKVSKIIDCNNHGTIYIGGRSSPSFIRIYDKALEIKEKNRKLLGIVSSDIEEDFTRVEFEFKNHSLCKNAVMAFKLYLLGDDDIGAMCYKYLKIFENPVDENVDDNPDWDVYKSVILSNNKEFQIEYNKSADYFINLSYLQSMANMITTYCRRMPGLCTWLKENLSESKSAIRKTMNVRLDFSELVENASEIHNEQEYIILEHLTFFDDCLRCDSYD